MKDNQTNKLEKKIGGNTVDGRRKNSEKNINNNKNTLTTNTKIQFQKDKGRHHIHEKRKEVLAF